MGFPRQESWSELPFPSPGGESSWSRVWIHISCIGRWILYHLPTREALTPHRYKSKTFSPQFGHVVQRQMVSRLGTWLVVRRCGFHSAAMTLTRDFSNTKHKYCLRVYCVPNLYQTPHLPFDFILSYKAGVPILTLYRRGLGVKRQVKFTQQQQSWNSNPRVFATFLSL